MVHDPSDGMDVELLLRLSARWLLTMPSVQHYLDHLAKHGPALFGGALTDDPAEVAAAPAGKVMRADAPGLLRGLGWSIATKMPLPALGWKPHRLTLPGRNDPCLCGSGAKFKHCCQRLIQRAPPIDPMYLGSLVVLELPAREWAALPASHVHPDMVAAAAHDLSTRGQLRDALRLLEPWGKAAGPWTQARVDVLDLLADLYLDLGHPRKRQALARAMVERGDRFVQSLGWQRQSMMASDRGEAALAREAFERAQRLTPDDPRVALLEVTTLFGAGEMARARERAAFHARRLARLPQADDLAPSIEGLEAIARGEMDHLARGAMPHDDEDQGSDFETAEIGVFDELQAWVEGQPAPRLRLDLKQATPQDLGELKPDGSLRHALEDWRDVFQFEAGHDGLATLDLAPVSTLLRFKPQLLDSFDVLDDLVRGLRPVPLGLASGLQAALLKRAMDLWALLRARFPQARCEWGWMGNRPALRLLVERIAHDRTPTAQSSFEWLCHLVQVLNPNDNQGLRERLAAVLLRRGDAAAALALAERYPDDFVGMQLLHARALLELQRVGDAGAVFTAALEANRHVLKLLRASRAPTLPDVDSYRVGSPEQARLVVAAQHDLWRSEALRRWLKQPWEGGPVQLTLT